MSPPTPPPKPSHSLWFWVTLFAAKDLIKHLLKVDMESRLTVNQAYRHEWIKEVLLLALLAALLISYLLSLNPRSHDANTTDSDI